MSEDNPWKTVRSKIVYENAWIKVREDAVITPSGDEGIYGVVESRIAVGIIPIFEDNTTTLVGQFRYPNQVYSWEIIEGGAEKNEDPLEAARREMIEEAGLQAQEIRALGGEFHLTNAHSSEVGFLYTAHGLTECEKDPEPTEVIATKRIHLSDALELVENGTIKDSVSIVGIYRVCRQLGII